MLAGIASPLMSLLLAGPVVDKAADSDAGARKVLQAIVAAATQEAKKNPPARGDALTEIYVRAAARAATELPAETAGPALLLALGIALDDSTLLRNNLLLSRRIKAIEPDEARKQRLAVLGSPTMRGRRDLCQHFAVSCTLTECVGEKLAEQLGILKEERDSRAGGSGFSFADLQADLAGIELAVRVKKGEIKLATLAEQFRVADFLPDHAGLDEGLNAPAFAKKYGSTSDPRFQQQVQAIRATIRKLPGHAGKKP